MSRLVKRIGLIVVGLIIGWPLIDGCWRGFLGSPDWRNDALFHSATLGGATGLFFLLPVLIQRLKPSPR